MSDLPYQMDIRLRLQLVSDGDCATEKAAALLRHHAELLIRHAAALEDGTSGNEARGGFVAEGIGRLDWIAGAGHLTEEADGGRGKD